MAYSIYIGTPEKMKDLILLGSFTKIEHDTFFAELKTINRKKGMILEFSEYTEFINLAGFEIIALVKEIKEIIQHDRLKNNQLLNCMLKAGFKASQKNLELMATGQE